MMRVAGNARTRHEALMLAVGGAIAVFTVPAAVMAAPDHVAAEIKKLFEVIEVKTLISHEMESGNRKDAAGKPIPRKIIKQLTAAFNGKPIIKADWHAAVAANPYQSFFVRLQETGTFSFEWLDDDGSVYKTEQKVTVG